MPDSPNQKLPWIRFWSPRETRTHGASSEFFEDPQGTSGKHLHPQAATLDEITPETGLLVLCGEPGLGKTPQGRYRQETPLSITIEVKGCWNSQIKTGAEGQLLNGYLRPFGLTHGVFLVAWFHSPGFEKIAPAQASELDHETLGEAKNTVASFVQPAQVPGFEVIPFVLDCRIS